MSSSGRSPWKEVNRHIRGFDSLNCLKPYWLRIMIISVLFFYVASTIATSLEEVIEYLTTYIYEAVLHIIGSFSVASHYIIRLKNIFYQLFFKLWWFRLYMVELRRFHIYVCACVWPCVVFLCILGILRAATCACMCAYILSFQIKAISLIADF